MLPPCGVSEHMGSTHKQFKINLIIWKQKINNPIWTLVETKRKVQWFCPFLINSQCVPVSGSYVRRCQTESQEEQRSHQWASCSCHRGTSRCRVGSGTREKRGREDREENILEFCTTMARDIYNGVATQYLSMSLLKSWTVLICFLDYFFSSTLQVLDFSLSRA